MVEEWTYTLEFLFCRINHKLWFRKPSAQVDVIRYPPPMSDWWFLKSLRRGLRLSKISRDRLDDLTWSSETLTISLHTPGYWERLDVLSILLLLVVIDLDPLLPSWHVPPFSRVSKRELSQVQQIHLWYSSADSQPSSSIIESGHTFPLKSIDFLKRGMTMEDAIPIATTVRSIARWFAYWYKKVSKDISGIVGSSSRPVDRS